MQTREKRVFGVLDAMRGVAAVFVMVRHSQFFIGHTPFHENYLAVDLFFLLSGIVLAHAYEERLRERNLTGKLRFIYVRLVRIYPLYAVGLLIALAAAFVGTESARQDVLPLTAFALALLPSPLPGHQELYPLNIASWSLFFELAVNVLYAFAARHLTGVALRLIVAACGIALIGSAFLQSQPSLDVGWSQGTFVAGFPRVGFSFFLGVLLHRSYIDAGSPSFGPERQAVLTCGLVGVVALVLMGRPSMHLRPYYDLAMVMVAFPAVVYAALRVHPVGLVATACKELGLISYAVYAVHQPLARLLEFLSRRLGVASLDGHRILAAALFTAALVGLCRWLDGSVDAPIRKALLAANGTWGRRPALRAATPRE